MARPGADRPELPRRARRDPALERPAAIGRHGGRRTGADSTGAARSPRRRSAFRPRAGATSPVPRRPDRLVDDPADRRALDEQREQDDPEGDLLEERRAAGCRPGGTAPWPRPPPRADRPRTGRAASRSGLRPASPGLDRSRDAPPRRTYTTSARPIRIADDGPGDRPERIEQLGRRDGEADEQEHDGRQEVGDELPDGVDRVAAADRARFVPGPRSRGRSRPSPWR